MPRHLSLYDDLEGMPSPKPGPANPEPPPMRVVDPVCEMTFTPGGAHGGRRQYGTKTYFFCSHVCRARFEAAPERFAPAPTASAPREPAEALHPLLERLRLLTVPTRARAAS